MQQHLFRDVIADIGLMTEEIAACTESDYVVVADAESSEAFEKAVTEVNRNMETRDGGETSVEYDTTEVALKEHPEVNLVHIAVPGDCAGGGEESLERRKAYLRVQQQCALRG